MKFATSIQQQIDFYCQYGVNESEELKKLSRDELIALVEYDKVTIENLRGVKPLSDYLEFQKPVDIVSFEIIDCLETTKTELVDHDFVSNVGLNALSKKVKVYADLLLCNASEIRTVLETQNLHSACNLKFTRCLRLEICTLLAT